MIVSPSPILSFVSPPFSTGAHFTTAVPSTRQRLKTQPQQKRGRRWRRRYTLVLLLAAFMGFVAYYNVDRTFTNEDRHYVHLLLPDLTEGCAVAMSYEAQLALIQRIQQALLTRAPLLSGIEEGTPRELKQVYLARKGFCYDRSRALEKIFVYTGFETRHVSVFKREPGVHPVKTVLFHHVRSHAISEVKTKRGWMIVDSNATWSGLDVDNNPVSMAQLATRYSGYPNYQPVRWLITVPDDDVNFYSEQSIHVYGLYSRHGRFFPPYTSYIPDYRIRGLLYNFEWTTNEVLSQ